MAQYNHKLIEPKWTKRWEDNPVNVNDGKKSKYYCLDMFPYPSGNGLHVGHWRGYVISDVWSRYQIMNNKYVIHPMGWDAFGLPAENYAIKNGVHPSISTEKNISNIKRQIKQIGAVYDWDLEVNTTDPKYYKWTQWIFEQMYKNGLAYEKKMPINWCPSCKTGLANEEVKEGCCERCGSVVTKKNVRQWMLKITAYADRLISGLDDVKWPEKVKKMQKEWIGKSQGAEVNFKIDGKDESITVYTTRPDTLYGATFMVVAPEAEIAGKLYTPETEENVKGYINQTSQKSSVERMADHEKTGVFTGSYALNPLNGNKVPIWLSDYVLADYGTGAIMCVPAHDERDFEFAKKFDLPIIPVISPDGKTSDELTEPYIGKGIVINSGEWNGMDSDELKKKAPHIIEQKGFGKAKTNYKLRDWVFSRQRYWGEPIPIIHCPNCGEVLVPEDELPLELPAVDKYEPTGTGESPLAAIDSWVNCKCPKCKGAAKRETNTMPQWAGSSWYFLRYVDVNNDIEAVSREKADKYLPVDLYVGGVEHAVLHLLYARFWTKFLHDIGMFDFDEPFQKLFNQGMVDGKDKVTGKPTKMSKSLGNIVSPDDIVDTYGCDSLRLYELFMGPPDQDAIWDDAGLEGIYRFVKRFYSMVTDNIEKDAVETPELVRLRNQLVKTVTERFNSFSLNTVISAFMEFNNKFVDLTKKTGVDRETLETFVRLIAPFAPHIGEELWEQLGHNDSVFHTSWPVFDSTKLDSDVITIPVQVSGKTRLTIEIPIEASKDEVLTKAKEALGSRLNGLSVIKEIYVPKKIVNIVAK